jgi:hypothetical protein
MLKVKVDGVPKIKKKTCGKYVYSRMVCIFSSAFLTQKFIVSKR